MSRQDRWLLCITVAICLGCFSACSPGWWFEGRILIFNMAGEDFQSLTLIVDGRELELPPTAREQACWKVIQANHSLGFRWQTAAGEEFGVSEPLKEVVPHRSRDDLVIQILGPATMKVEKYKLPKRLAGLERRS